MHACRYVCIITCVYAGLRVHAHTCTCAESFFCVCPLLLLVLILLLTISVYLYACARQQTNTHEHITVGYFSLHIFLQRQTCTVPENNHYVSSVEVFAYNMHAKKRAHAHRHTHTDTHSRGGERERETKREREREREATQRQRIEASAELMKFSGAGQGLCWRFGAQPRLIQIIGLQLPGTGFAGSPIGIRTVASGMINSETLADLIFSSL